MSPFGQHTTGDEVVVALKDQVKGRTFVITGASQGSIGGETALYLAAGTPASLVLLGRTPSKVTPVIQEIAKISPSTKVHFVQIDLSTQSSVRRAGAEALALAPKIDVLINNAGIMATPTFTKSVEGIESQFATNHIGHFLLTSILLPSILRASTPSQPSRIVNLSSAGHAMAPVRFEDWNFSDGKVYDEWDAYGQSKCANVLFSVELARRLKDKGVLSFSVHPGNIHETNLGKHLVDPDWPMILKRFEDVGYPVPAQKTLAEGCSTSLAAALDPSLQEHSGCYLDDCQPFRRSEFSGNPENAEKLWALSEKLIGEKFEC